MAKIKKHIDQELKAKVGQYSAPIGESDWASFEQFRDKQKSKRRGLIYFVTAAALVFLAVSSLVLWNLKEKHSSDEANKPAQETTQSQHESVTPSANKTDQSSSDGTEELNAPEQVLNENSVKENGSTQNQKGTMDGSDPSNQRKTEESLQDQPEQKMQPNEGLEVLENPLTEGLPKIGVSTIPKKAIAFPKLTWPWAEFPQVLAYRTNKEGDTSASINKNILQKGKPLLTPSLALGLVYGFGTPALEVGPADSTQTHFQYEQTLKGSKQSSQVFRVFAQYEYRLKLGVELGAGLQFSSTNQVKRYNFELRQIPYFGLNDEILTYFQIPDSQYVAPTVFESRQNIYSASIPVTVGYAYTFKNNLRFGVRANGQFGMNWSKDFIGLSPKTLSETSVKANVNPLNLSYGAGVFGEYFYLRTWSVRASMDWTAQNRQYSKSNSYNSTNQYYEFKLVLLKYL